MELYTRTSYDAARLVTQQYSTSFSASCSLFAPSIRQHIYAIYGMVRIADEIVDTYISSSKEQVGLLDDFEREVHAAIDRQYSTNLIIHAFALTARRYGIDKKLIAPFMESMRIDGRRSYTPDMYEKYIYGSAEAVGLMCLRVFVDGDEVTYQELADGARALGAAYQKVNFLRDIKQDYEQLGRVYFPGMNYKSFSDADKKAIEKTIATDFARARIYIERLPKNSRCAVRLSYDYYQKLLGRIHMMSAADVKSRRVRVNNFVKLTIYMRARLRS